MSEPVQPQPEPTECRSCGASVVFVTSAKSTSTMILNAEPGRGLLVARVRHVHLLVPTDASKRLDELVAGVVPVYTDHHATCPDTDDWRRS